MRINISFILRVGVWRGRSAVRAGAAQDNKFTYFTPQTDLFCHSAELRTYGNILLNTSAVRRDTLRIKLSSTTPHLEIKSRYTLTPFIQTTELLSYQKIDPYMCGCVPSCWVIPGEYFYRHYGYYENKYTSYQNDENSLNTTARHC